MALCAARERAAVPIAHLRAMNPYVQTSLEDWGKQGGLHGALPRAAAPLEALSSPDSAAGASLI